MTRVISLPTPEAGRLSPRTRERRREPTVPSAAIVCASPSAAPPSAPPSSTPLRRRPLRSCPLRRHRLSPTRSRAGREAATPYVVVHVRWFAVLHRRVQPPVRCPPSSSTARDPVQDWLPSKSAARGSNRSPSLRHSSKIKLCAKFSSAGSDP